MNIGQEIERETSMNKAQEKEMKHRRSGWKHITERERYKLEYMMKQKIPVAQIAEELGHSRSTIYREIKRGQVEQRDKLYCDRLVYLADYAQRDYDGKKHEKGRYLKVGNDMDFVRFVEHSIGTLRFSPIATLYAIKERPDIRTRVCHRTLYQYIHSGVFLNLHSSDLPYRVSKKREKDRKNIAYKNLKGKSIEERNKEVLKRDIYGHWEMDTVYSGKGKALDCLLVLTERMTREEEIYHMKSRTKDEVVRVLNDIENRIGLPDFIRRYKTITSDNGVEFLDFNGIEHSVTTPNTTRTTMYYCHPFCSGERGSNENQNKLIRRWIPKGADISLYKDKITFIQDWINTYPRKIFNGKSSRDIVLSLLE